LACRRRGWRWAEHQSRYGYRILAGHHSLIGISVITAAMLHMCLSIRTRLSTLITITVVSISALLLPLLTLASRPMNLMLILHLSVMLVGFAAWLVPALLLFRVQGHRLVQLPRTG
jgi:hypothetical protein